MATPTLAHFAADTEIEPLMAALRRDGAVIVDNVIAPDAIVALNAELAPYIAATPNGRDSFTGNLTTRTGALVARSEEVRALVMDRLIAAAANALLLPFCERWQLHLTQAIRISRAGRAGDPPRPLGLGHHLGTSSRSSTRSGR